ncbi:hypothetical protein FMUND_8695 [Fusarium mundagurra]|uniref:Uncharacterized protein n=1 Tax=Fusarium mundagurra TaxID=1567541 RepID=A0A8H5YG93_9HYPO|nr:hypothetical protein FMUND_8695 [Fusarium mundagurra]
MRRVLGPKSHNRWQNISMMIGWCLHVAETDRSVSVPRPWTATDAELSARLGVWGVPAFVRLALVGIPSEEGPSHSELLPKWQKDEERILGKVAGLGKVEDLLYGQQDGPSQAGAFNSAGSSIDTQYWSTENPLQTTTWQSADTEVPYGSTEAPYRIQENVLGPLGVTHVSEGLEPFGPVHQGSPPRKERSRWSGNSRKRARETEEDTSEEIHGLGGFDNFGYRERSKRVRGEGSNSDVNFMIKELKKMHEELKETHASFNSMSEMEDSDTAPEAWVTSESSTEG